MKFWLEQLLLDYSRIIAHLNLEEIKLERDPDQRVRLVQIREMRSWYITAKARTLRMLQLWEAASK